MEKSQDSQPAQPAEGAANRQGLKTTISKKLAATGHTMAVFLVLAFIAVFANSIFQLDFWQGYFFQGTVDVGGDCRVVAARQDSKNMQPIVDRMFQLVRVPHIGQGLVDLTGENSGKYVRGTYSCTITSQPFANAQETVYLHTGWIKAETAVIKINGTVRSSFNGMDKAIVPLTLEDRSDPTIHVEIDVLADAAGKQGLAYVSPFVVSQGTTENFRVLGVDYALASQKSLYDILPLLTLGVILAFGWLIGIRSTSLVVTFLYFTLSASHSLLWIFNDLWPWPYNITRDLSNLWLMGSLFAFLIFALEIFGFFRTRIFQFTAGLFALIVVSSLFISLVQPSFAVIDAVRSTLRVVLSAAMLILGHFGLRRIRNMRRTSPGELAEKAILKIVIGLLGFAVFATGWDAAAKDFGIAFRLSPQMYKLLPLFVGGVVLYSLYLIEKQLQEEKSRRSKIEGELTLAAKLQNVLLPSALTGEVHGFNYQIESVPHGILGGDWVKMHSGRDRALLVLGDVVGKGASAALTHSGIAASWESQIGRWEDGTASTDDLLKAINRTMFGLFRGEMNTTFAAIEIGPGGLVRLTAGGNYWLHLSPEKSKPVAAGAAGLLGVKADLKLTFHELALSKGDWLVCFTDGVLEGNRLVARFLKAIQPMVGSLTPESLRDALHAAGRGDVHPDDASIVVLKYGSIEKTATTAA